MWQVLGSNQRRLSRRFYSSPLRLVLQRRGLGFRIRNGQDSGAASVGRPYRDTRVAEGICAPRPPTVTALADRGVPAGGGWRTISDRLAGAGSG